MNHGVIRILAILTIASAARGGVVFQDDFSGGANEWVVLNTDTDLELDASGGELLVVNSGANVGIVKHDQVFEDFTWSVTLRAHGEEFSTLGMGFCLEENGAGGYYFTIDHRNNFMLSKLPAGGGAMVTITYLPHSFLSTGTNKLTVHKQGSTLTLYCNDRWAYSTTDETFASGKIALILPASKSAVYDNALVTTDAPSIPESPCFADDFSGDGLAGWYERGMSGSLASASGVLTIDTENGGTVFASGRYDQSSMRGIVRHAQGSKETPYGISFVTVRLAQNNTVFMTRNVAFVITGNRNFGLIRPDTASFTLAPPNTAVNGTTDTLEALWRDGAYVFVVNRDTLMDTVLNLPESDDYVIDGAGFYAGAGISLVCDAFSVRRGKDYVCPVEPPVRAGAPGMLPLSITTGGSKIFDLRGRLIGRPGALEFRGRPGHGTYLVDRNAAGMPRRLIKVEHDRQP